MSKKKKTSKADEAASPREMRRSFTLSRNRPFREVKPSFLIVCEGRNTEPSYFKQFRLSTAEIMAIGEGYNTLSLVKRAIFLAKQGEYDQVWCVFDKDDFSPLDFEKAFELAEQVGINIAYSNQSFEYWLLLHLQDHTGAPMHRREYAQRINAHLKPYKLIYHGSKGKKVSSALFDLFEAKDPKYGFTRRALAIHRARRIHEEFGRTPPVRAESSTTVYLLVEELLKYI